MITGPVRHARVGVVVLSYRSGSRLTETLRRVSAMVPAVDATLVVDNASGDDTIPSLRANLPSVDVLELEENVGYGAAMNRGARALVARGCELVLFLTHETLVTPDLVGTLADRLATREELAAVGPLLGWVSDQTTVWSAGGYVAPVWRVARHRGAGASMAAWAGQGPQEAEWLDGACLMVRADAFDSVGGFNEDLFLYWEDVDLCRRLRAAGFGVECIPTAIAYQEPSMAPPYLDARNRALVLGRLGIAASALDLVLHAVADPLRGRGLATVRLGARGLRDSLAGTLDLERALRRPK